MEKNEINKKIGQNLKLIRRQLELSQDHLAIMIGLTRTSIVNIEKGRQSLTIENLYNISDKLDIHIMDILVDSRGSINMVLESKIRELEVERDSLKRKYNSLKNSLSDVLGHLKNN